MMVGLTKSLGIPSDPADAAALQKSVFQLRPSASGEHFPYLYFAFIKKAMLENSVIVFQWPVTAQQTHRFTFEPRSAVADMPRSK